MCKALNFRRSEPLLAAWLFLGLSMVSFHGPDGLLWTQPLPWLLLAISAGLWRAHGWARTLAIVVLAALLGAMAWPGGVDLHSVRVLLVEPWAAVHLEQRTGLHPSMGGTLVASALLLWLLSPPVRRAFALSDLDALRASLPPLADSSVRHAARPSRAGASGSAARRR